MARLFIAAPLVVLLSLAACGGDDDEPPSDVAQYFDEVRSLDERAGDQIGKLDAADFAEPGEPSQLQSIKDFYGNFASEFRRVISDAESMDPPESLRPQHDAYVDAGRELADSSEAFVTRLQDASSLEEAEQLLEEDTPDVDAAYERFTDACQELQQAADTQGVEIELNC